MKKFFYLCFLLPLLSFAKEAPSRPAWVDGNAEGQYPEAKFMTAVGGGSTREAAAANAKKNLASSFLQKVKSESNAQSKSNLTEDTNAQSSGDATSSSQSDVQISSNVEVRGMEVKEYWTDPETDQQYALAVLDKLKVRNSYNLDLSRMKDRLLSLRDSFNSKPDRKSGRALLDLAKNYADLEKEASMVGAPMPLSDPISGKELQAIQDKLDELKSSAPIALAINADKGSSSDEADDLQQMVADCLEEKGYTLTEGEDSVGKLVGAYSTKSKHLKVDGFVSYDFRVRVAFKKGKHSDNKFFSQNAKGREIDQAFDDVKQNLSDSICSMITQIL